MAFRMTSQGQEDVEDITTDIGKETETKEDRGKEEERREKERKRDLKI